MIGKMLTLKKGVDNIVGLQSGEEYKVLIEEQGKYGVMSELGHVVFVEQELFCNDQPFLEKYKILHKALNNGDEVLLHEGDCPYIRGKVSLLRDTMFVLESVSCGWLQVIYIDDFDVVVYEYGDDE